MNNTHLKDCDMILSADPATGVKDIITSVNGVVSKSTMTGSGGQFGSINLLNCFGQPSPVNPADSVIIGKVEGNTYKDAENLSDDSNEMIRIAHSRAIQCVELVYNYAMFGIGNIQSSFDIPDGAKVLEVRNAVDVAFDGDFDNKIDVYIHDGAFGQTIMQQADSNLFIKSVYNNLLRYQNTNGGGKVQVNFSQTPYSTPPSKGQGFIQVFFVRETLS